MVVKLRGFGFSVEKYKAIAERKAVVTNAIIVPISSIGKNVPHNVKPAKKIRGTNTFVTVYELGLAITIPILCFSETKVYPFSKIGR